MCLSPFIWQGFKQLCQGNHWMHTGDLEVLPACAPLGLPGDAGTTRENMHSSEGPQLCLQLCSCHTPLDHSFSPAWLFSCALPM